MPTHNKRSVRWEKHQHFISVFNHINLYKKKTYENPENEFHSGSYVRRIFQCFNIFAAFHLEQNLLFLFFFFIWFLGFWNVRFGKQKHLEMFCALEKKNSQQTAILHGASNKHRTDDKVQFWPLCFTRIYVNREEKKNKKKITTKIRWTHFFSVFVPATCTLLIFYGVFV